MKNLNQNNSSTGQSTSEVRQSHKRDANLQKNSTLYFQIGLILCLLGTFALLEMQFEGKDYVIDRPTIDDELIEYAMNPVKEHIDEIKHDKELPKTQIIVDEVIPIENDTPDKLLPTLITEPTPSPKHIANIDDIPNAVPIEENISVALVQFVPIYPGCEKYKKNSKRVKCLNEKIGKLVQRKFDTGIASDHGLTGEQIIYVQFKVNKEGNITEIQTRAPHPKLREEAERTVNKIPQMQPGKMGNKPVNVIYTLPIKFKVEN